MKSDFKQIEKYRLDGMPEAMGRDQLYGRWLIEGLMVIAACGDETGWDHVSVSRVERTPSWQEMERVRRLFFEPTETVVQLHPPLGDYVNHHPHCLHLWRKVGAEHPLPPRHLV